MIALTDDYVLSTIAKRKGSTTSGRLKFDSDCADTKVCRAYYDAVQAGLINLDLPNEDREAFEDAYFLEYAPDPEVD